MSATENWKTALLKIPVDDRANVEERAGIHEFDGKADRDTAERLAIADYWRERGEFGI